MVEKRKVDYVNSKRLDKPLVALDIIAQWRKQKPPGRFLKFDDKTELWNDVGDKKAREKTSQALREKAPQLRKQQEEQRKEKKIQEVEHISMEASAELEPVVSITCMHALMDDFYFFHQITNFSFCFLYHSHC